jgi:FkbM family methyltransferase
MRHWAPYGRRPGEIPARFREDGIRRAQGIGALLGLKPREAMQRLFYPGPPVTVSYQGVTLVMRPGTTDIQTLYDTFAIGYHRSPWPLPDGATIVDLGANIGFTLVDYALTHRDVTLIGVEMDAGNAALARKNTAALGDRCRVIDKAVAAEAGVVRYDDSADTDAYSIGQGNRTVEAVTVSWLVDSLCDVRRIDMLKVDIEGEERRVLTENTEWVDRLDRLLVEVHPPWTVDECIAALEHLGFRAEPNLRHWSGVMAHRPG